MIPQQLIDTNTVAVPFIIQPPIIDSAINTVVKKDSVKKIPKKVVKKTTYQTIKPIEVDTTSTLVIDSTTTTILIDSSFTSPFDKYKAYDLDSLNTLMNFTTNITEYQLYKVGKKYERPAYLDFQLYIILFAISLIGFTRAFNRKRFNEYLHSFFSRNGSIQISRNEKVYTHRANLLLLLAYISVTSLLILQIIDLVGIKYQWNAFQFLILIGLGVVSIYGIKILIHKMLSLILGFKQAADEFIFNIVLYNLGSLFLLLPCVLISSFGPAQYQAPALSVASIIVVLSISFRLIRGVQVGISNQVNFVYLFLYLCTLEILPLIIVSKMLFF